jgi:hypothetical protein
VHHKIELLRLQINKAIATQRKVLDVYFSGNDVYLGSAPGYISIDTTKISESTANVSAANRSASLPVCDCANMKGSKICCDAIVFSDYPASPTL